MEKKKLGTIVSIITTPIIEMIAKEYGISTNNAASEFYASKTYSYLEDPEMEVWHFSPLAIFEVFMNEKNTGKVIFPEANA